MVFRDVLVEAMSAQPRSAMRCADGAPHRVYYRVTGRKAERRVDGVSVARSESTLETREWLLPLAVALPLIALLPAPDRDRMLASVISNRISRRHCKFGTRCARSSEGDYSVRLAPARATRFGQVTGATQQDGRGLDSAGRTARM
jgi:hypothetical protein